MENIFDNINALFKPGLFLLRWWSGRCNSSWKNNCNSNWNFSCSGSCNNGCDSSWRGRNKTGVGEFDVNVLRHGVYNLP